MSFVTAPSRAPDPLPSSETGGDSTIEALVVGGGPAGAVLATGLARAGRRVTLLESERVAKDKVCGELISSEAALYLAEAGIDLPMLGAVPIHFVRVVAGDQVAERELASSAFGLSRRVLDEAMLDCARAVGVRLIRGATAQSLAAVPSGFCARLVTGARFESAAMFLATGRHDVRGPGFADAAGDDWVAIKIHFRLKDEPSRAIERSVELVLFRGGYAALQPIEHGLANFCAVVRRREFARHGHRFENLLADIRRKSPHLRHRLEGADSRSSRPLVLSSTGRRTGEPAVEGVFRLGDRSTVSASFAVDGLSTALHRGRLASQTFLDGGGAAIFERLLARDVERRARSVTGWPLDRAHASFQREFVRFARFVPGILSDVTFRSRVTDAALQRLGLVHARP